MERKPVTLPASLMASIKAVAEDPAISPTQSLEAIVLLTYGYALWDRMEGTLNPTAVVLPKAQWMDIANHLANLPGDEDDPIARVNKGMDWVNIGPSAADDDDAQVA